MTYMIDTEMMGPDATDEERNMMVALLTERGYDVAAGSGQNDEDYIPDGVWDECLWLIGFDGADA